MACDGEMMRSFKPTCTGGAVQCSAASAQMRSTFSSIFASRITS